MPIRTDFIYPPIPSRNFDWAAWIDGEEESGRCGYGRTEAEAVQNLTEQLDEDPECTCIQVDVDLYDARGCEAHDRRAA